MSTLLFLNLAGNDHTGKLPALPPNARLFNVSGNSVSGGQRRRQAASAHSLRSNCTCGGCQQHSTLIKSTQMTTPSNPQLSGELPAFPDNLVSLDVSRGEGRLVALNLPCRTP